MHKEHRLTRATFPSRSLFRAAGELISLSVSPGDGSKKAKFTCVVSKKISKKATERNRLKRQCREAMSPFMQDLPPFSYVIYPKKQAVVAEYASIVEELGILIDRALKKLS